MFFKVTGRYHGEVNQTVGPPKSAPDHLLLHEWLFAKSALYRHLREEALKKGFEFIALAEEGNPAAERDLDRIWSEKKIYFSRYADRQIQPVLHETAHALSYEILFADEDYQNPLNPSRWFLRHVLSEAFCNTAEQLLRLSLVEEVRHPELRLAVYRYVPSQAEGNLKRYLAEHDPKEAAGYMLASYFLANLRIFDTLYSNEDILGAEQAFGVGSRLPLDVRKEILLSSLLLNNPSRVRTQAAYFAKFGFPRIGAIHAKKDLRGLLSVDPDLVPAFGRLMEIFVAMEDHERAQV